MPHLLISFCIVIVFHRVSLLSYSLALYSYHRELFVYMQVAYIINYFYLNRRYRDNLSRMDEGPTTNVCPLFRGFIVYMYIII